jgi:hypothetical protein
VLDGKAVFPVRFTVTEVAPAGMLTLDAINCPIPDIVPSMRAPEIGFGGAGETLNTAVALIVLPDTNTEGELDVVVQTVFDLATGVGLLGESSQTGTLLVYCNWDIESVGGGTA